MKKYGLTACGIMLCILAGPCVSAQGLERAQAEGQVRSVDQTLAAVWNAEAQAWQSSESHWEHYAVRHSGNDWGGRRGFRPYDQINELTTVIFELRSSACLKEFSHSRWRRANDVRRWNTCLTSTTDARMSLTDPVAQS